MLDLIPKIMRGIVIILLTTTAMINSINTPSMPIVFAIVALAIVIDRKTIN